MTLPGHVARSWPLCRGCWPRALTEVMRGWLTTLSVRGQASPSISSISGGTSAVARARGQLAQSVLPITAAWQIAEVLQFARGQAFAHKQMILAAPE